MGTVLWIIGTLVFGFVLSIILKQSYNFIFILFKNPFLWIVAVVFVALIVWALSSLLKWSVFIPAWACAIAIFTNIPPRQKNSSENQVIKAMADEMYLEMGIKHGRLLHRIDKYGTLLTNYTKYFMTKKQKNEIENQVCQKRLNRKADS
jgi:hypothetical protein